VLTRRTVLELAAAPLLLPGRGPLLRAAPRVVVVGAGAFGEMVAGLVLSDGTADPLLRLSRLAKQ
jgi:hypothetical protein